MNYLYRAAGAAWHEFCLTGSANPSGERQQRNNLYTQEVSKAFTKEDDQSEEVTLRPRVPLPTGVKNYITAAGAERLRRELATLLAEKSSEIDGQGSQPRDARIHQLQEILPTLVVTERPREADVIRFGATVSLQRQSGREVYRLVGVDEINLDENQISWLSPLGKLLLGKRAGDRLKFSSPAGKEEILVESVTYD